MRLEKDMLGQMELHGDTYYGIQTERAKNNFNISTQKICDYEHFIWCLAAIKKSAAMANRDINVLEKELANSICSACDEIMEGKLIDQFIVDVFQGGGATSTNMNINEVIANRANEILTGKKGYDRVDPLKHVNMGQSTNDVIPSAIKLASYKYLDKLRASAISAEAVFEKKMKEFDDVVIMGKTCLQDALPITLGQRFSGYLFFIKRQIKEIEEMASDCLNIPLGATAIGTGLGTYPGYRLEVYSYLNKIVKLNVTEDENFFDGLQNGDFYIKVSGFLKGFATGLSKISKDLRLLSSGPNVGFCEIQLPSVQPGSSIMPGKVNPVIPEMMIQVGYQVCGNDTAISMAVEGGELDLNVWESIIMKCLFDSCILMANSILIFADKCVAGIEVDREVCRRHAYSCLPMVDKLLGKNKCEGNTSALDNFQLNNVEKKVIEDSLINEEVKQLDKLMKCTNLTESEKMLHKK